MERYIETERMILRPLTRNDAKDAFEWLSDPMVNRYMPYSLYTNIKQVEEWIDSIDESSNEFAFYLKDINKVIGSGEISYIPDRKAYELGYNINRSYWGKGYATEASKAMIQWAYDNLTAREFTCNHATANIASGNVIKKCGFEFGHYGQYSKFDGSKSFDAAFYTMHLD